MSCKKGLLKVFVFLLVLCIIATLFTGCGGNNTVSNAYRSVNGTVLESQTLASNQNYELLWDKDGRAVIFKSLTSGKYWSDILYDSFLEGSMSANSNSPISITVANTKTLKWDTVTSYSQIGEYGSVMCKKLDNGIRVTYFFDTYKIAIPVDYFLNEDSLSITVDSSKILEDGTDYKLVSVSVAPFLCNVKNDAVNASLFVPSGSGAIMYAVETPDGTREYTGEVYGRDAARRNPLSLVDKQEVRLPVFGAYGNRSGIMGIIKQGAESCEITAQAGNSRLGYSNVGAVFYVRGYDEFSYVYHGNYKGITSRVNENISGQVLTVSYYDLQGDSADYNGIAQKYRDYLLDEGMLDKSQDNGSAYAVTLLGGTNITTSIFGIPNKKLVPLTTFSQAAEILGELQKNIGAMPYIRMMGYGDNGIRVGSIAGGKKYPSVYGSKNELNSLLKAFGNENLFFDYDIVNFSKSSFGFSLNFDAAKTAILYKAEHFPVSALRVNDEDNPYYIISRDKLGKASIYALKKAANYKIGAVSFSSLGSTAFSDENYISKQKIEADVAQILKNIKADGYKTAVADANSYAACVADVIFDTDTDNGDYDSLDLEIPFYQMVFHSYKPMYTNAVNLEDNTSLAIAKAAAYGMGIGYTLSYSYVDKSDDLGEYELYGTVYSDNAEGIYGTLIENGYMDLYSAIKDAELIRYEIDKNGVSKSEFSNGRIVYVNQTKNAVNTPVGELAPYEFLVS